MEIIFGLLPCVISLTYATVNRAQMNVAPLRTSSISPAGTFNNSVPDSVTARNTLYVPLMSVHFSISPWDATEVDDCNISGAAIMVVQLLEWSLNLSYGV
jgi:hypothetical protein